MNRKTGNSRSSARVMATRRAVLCALALALVAGAAGGLANSPTAILDVAALGDVDDMPASLEKVKFVKLYRAQKSSPNLNHMCLERIEVKHVDGRSLERANGVNVEASSSHAQPCEENGNNYGGCQQKTTNGKVCAMWNDRPGATEAAFRRRLPVIIVIQCRAAARGSRGLSHNPTTTSVDRGPISTETQAPSGAGTDLEVIGIRAAASRIRTNLPQQSS